MTTSKTQASWRIYAESYSVTLWCMLSTLKCPLNDCLHVAPSFALDGTLARNNNVKDCRIPNQENIHRRKCYANDLAMASGLT